MKLINILNTSRIHEGVASDNSFELPPTDSARVDKSEEGLARLKSNHRHSTHVALMLNGLRADTLEGIIQKYPQHVHMHYALSPTGWTQHMVYRSTRNEAKFSTERFALFIADNSPPEVMQAFNLTNKYYKRIVSAVNRLEYVDIQIKVLSRYLNARDMAKAKKTTRVTIAPANVPEMLSAYGAGKFDNPAGSVGYTDKYAGSPEHYTWPRGMQTIFQTLNRILTERGIPRFDTLYAGKYNGIEDNFIAVAANEGVIWRKFDLGSFNTANSIFVTGLRSWLPISNIIDSYKEDDTKELDRVFAGVMKKGTP